MVERVVDAVCERSSSGQFVFIAEHVSELLGAVLFPKLLGDRVVFDLFLDQLSCLLVDREVAVADKSDIGAFLGGTLL